MNSIRAVLIERWNGYKEATRLAKGDPDVVRVRDSDGREFDRKWLYEPRMVEVRSRLESLCLGSNESRMSIIRSLMRMISKKTLRDRMHKVARTNEGLPSNQPLLNERLNAIELASGASGEFDPRFSSCYWLKLIGKLVALPSDINTVLHLIQLASQWMDVRVLYD